MSLMGGDESRSEQRMGGKLELYDTNFYEIRQDILGLLQNKTRTQRMGYLYSGTYISYSSPFQHVRW